MYRTSAMAVGALISLMLMANGALQVAFGPATSMVILHATGTAVLIILLLAKRASFVRSEAVPAYLFLSGALGVLLVFLNNTTVAAIGLTQTIALGVIGQLVVSSLVDHYGLFGLEKRAWNPRKIAGLTLILSGVAVMTGTQG